MDVSEVIDIWFFFLIYDYTFIYRYEKHLEVLYRITYVGTFNISIQALMLIFQVSSDREVHYISMILFSWKSIFFIISSYLTVFIYVYIFIYFSFVSSVP